MNDRELAAWIASEHKVVNHLVECLKVDVASVPSDDRESWLQRLRQDFSRLRAHLKEHFKAEEADGFMRPVLDRRPTLAREVQNLQDAHGEMSGSLDLIWEHFENLDPNDDTRLADVCHLIQHLIAAVEHHEDREELLVTYVFSQDIGTHD